MASRKIRLPAKDFARRDLPVGTTTRLDLFRVHPGHYPAIGFRLVEEHRFSHPEAPGGLMYLGDSVTTCLQAGKFAETSIGDLSDIPEADAFLIDRGISLV